MTIQRIQRTILQHRHSIRPHPCRRVHRRSTIDLPVLTNPVRMMRQLNPSPRLTTQQHRDETRVALGDDRDGSGGCLVIAEAGVEW